MKPHKVHKLIECGCCGCYHSSDWDGDCRDNDNRFADEEDYVQRTGTSPKDIRMIWLDDPRPWDD